MIEIKGTRGVVGVKLSQRGGDADRHVMVTILKEDDGHWWESDVVISNFWLDDLIEVLQQAKAKLDQMPDDPSGYGKVFPF